MIQNLGEVIEDYRKVLEIFADPCNWKGAIFNPVDKSVDPYDTANQVLNKYRISDNDVKEYEEIITKLEETENALLDADEEIRDLKNEIEDLEDKLEDLKNEK